MAKAKHSRVTHREIGVIPGCTMLPPGSQPALYDGPMPSFECQAYIRSCERSHEEWQRKRADIKGWAYNTMTGVAEPTKVVKKVRKLEAA